MLGLRFCARAFSSCGKQGPLFIAVHGPLTITASLVAEHRLQTRRLSNCGSRAQLLHGMWDLPRPGLEPTSPALAGGFLTTAPPGKPWIYLFLIIFFLIFYYNSFILFYFILFLSFYFFLPYILSRVNERLLVLQPGIKAVPLRWESQLQDTGPQETSQLHVIPNSENLSEISISTSIPSFTQRPASYSAGHPMPNN